MRTLERFLILLLSILIITVKTALALILAPPVSLEVVVPSTSHTSSYSYASFLTASSLYDSTADTRTVSDRVVRVVEDSTFIKLEKTGLVSLAGIQFPKKYDNNNMSCPTRTTSVTTKLQQLLPPHTAVRVYTITEKDNRGICKVLLFRSSHPKSQNQNKNNVQSPPTSIQTQLLLRGYAIVRDPQVAILFSPSLKDEWYQAQEEAGQQQQSPCRPTVESEFESLRPSIVSTTPPKNPGDSKGCSDFGTYEDALRWYERYFPYYGDVAKLDRDHDGIPCPGLPHTLDPELYRRKVSSSHTN